MIIFRIFQGVICFEVRKVIIRKLGFSSCVFRSMGSVNRSKYRNFVLYIHSTHLSVEANDNLVYKINFQHYNWWSLIFELLNELIRLQPTQHGLNKYLQRIGFARLA